MMLRRQRDQHVFLCQLFEDQIRRSRHGRSDDCNLHLFAEQRFGQALSAVGMEIERYRGVIVDVGPQRARDGGVQRGGGGQPDRDAAGLSHGGRASPRCSALDPAQQRARVLQ